jgi:hypothetical protein
VDKTLELPPSGGIFLGEIILLFSLLQYFSNPFFREYNHIRISMAFYTQYLEQALFFPGGEQIAQS